MPSKPIYFDSVSSSELTPIRSSERLFEIIVLSFLAKAKGRKAVKIKANMNATRKNLEFFNDKKTFKSSFKLHYPQPEYYGKKANL